MQKVLLTSSRLFAGDFSQGSDRLSLRSLVTQKYEGFLFSVDLTPLLKLHMTLKVLINMTNSPTKVAMSPGVPGPWKVDDVRGR